MAEKCHTTEFQLRAVNPISPLVAPTGSLLAPHPLQRACLITLTTRPLGCDVARRCSVWSAGVRVELGDCSVLMVCDGFCVVPVVRGFLAFLITASAKMHSLSFVLPFGCLDPSQPFVSSLYFVGIWAGRMVKCAPIPPFSDRGPRDSPLG